MPALEATLPPRVEAAALKGTAALPRKCVDCGHRIGWVELFFSLFLGLFKLVIGIISNSHALIASSLYSAQDFFSSVIVIISMKHQKKAPTEDYPYGFGKIEYVAAGALCLAVFLGAITLLIAATRVIFMGVTHPAQWVAFWAAIVAFGANIMLHRYSECAGKRIGSPAILTTSEHVKGDAVSSILVAVAVLGTKAGIHHLDPMIAILEVAHIMFMLYHMLKHSVGGLMDASLPEGELAEIREIVSGVGGVEGITDLKTRAFGQTNEICVEIEMNPRMRLGAAELIRQSVKENLLKRLERPSTVQIFFAPAGSGRAEASARQQAVREALAKFYLGHVKRHHLEITPESVALRLTFYSQVHPGMRKQICSAVVGDIKRNTKGGTVTVSEA